MANEANIKATLKTANEEATTWTIEGKIGRKTIKAGATFSNDGGEAWWEDGGKTGGIEPGDEDAGWDKILLAIAKAEKEAQ